MTEKKTNLHDLNILLGVTGGIAAYKAVDLAARLTAQAANVKTVMTKNACQFVGQKSFEAITCSQVFTSLWNSPEEYKISHINLVEWADIIVVVPATANIIGKVANGICDDLLSTLLCVCWQKPALFAPAMNDNMWKNPAVQRNIETLKETGFKLIGPETGRLACGSIAIGRMAEPSDIIEAVKKIASEIKKTKK